MHMCTKQMPSAFIFLVSSGSIPPNASYEVLIWGSITQQDYEGESWKRSKFASLRKLKSNIGPRTVDS